MLAALLAVAGLAIVAWFVRGGRGGMRALATLDRGQARRRYRRTIARGVVAFGASSIVGLALIGRLGALLRVPVELVPLRAPLLAVAEPASYVDAAAIGIAAGEIVLMALLLVQRARGKGAGMPIGGAGLMPRDVGELRWAALLAVTSGVVEELFFRLFLPLVMAMVIGYAVVGLGVAAAAFAAVHRYQGWRGMAATGAVGLVLAAVYLGSGCLWLAVAVHVAINLNALVVRPVVGGAVSFHHPGEGRRPVGGPQ
ncbi:CPBP family intramembrane glutamic endopeptidase [uncultured Sphingomonas sp.]|uniref:CPBP family intramembrane glutamic endopeptidase n=1 Tax=uncultured Sphingomonas sp. TaxID=158754 RepID=UPI0035CB7AD9